MTAGFHQQPWPVLHRMPEGNLPPGHSREVGVAFNGEAVTGQLLGT